MCVLVRVHVLKNAGRERERKRERERQRDPDIRAERERDPDLWAVMVNIQQKLFGSSSVGEG